MTTYSHIIHCSSVDCRAATLKASTRSAAEKHAKADGWLNAIGDVWLCPRCAGTKRGECDNIRQLPAVTRKQDKSHLFIDAWRKAYPDAPLPTAEYPFTKPLGRKHRADWCFVEQRLIVEVDGGQYAKNGGRHSRDSDREKLNLAAALGYRVMHFSPQMLTKDPTACCRVVAMALQIVALPAAVKKTRRKDKAA